jgi:hypothetical protein
MRDGPNKSAEAPIISSEFEDLVYDGPIFPLKFARKGWGRENVRAFVKIDAEGAVAVGLGSTGNTSLQAHERHCKSAAGQLDTFRNFSDHADLGVFVSSARY